MHPPPVRSFEEIHAGARILIDHAQILQGEFLRLNARLSDYKTRLDSVVAGVAPQTAARRSVDLDPAGIIQEF